MCSLNMKLRGSVPVVAVGLMVIAPVWSQTLGPDVIVGELGPMNDYARGDGIAALAMTTISCNVGDQPLQWRRLPDNRHPVIAQNFYRLKDGRMEQIGQAWVKHGFTALQMQTCFSDCVPTASTQLGVHCSDPYVASLNEGLSQPGPGLGPRSEINPVTGYFDGATANNHHGHVHTAISHGLQVPHVDIGNPGARYFAEAQYIAADDALAGNGNNNVSHREFRVTGTGANWSFAVADQTVREQPAVLAWPEADFVVLDSWPEDGRIIVAYHITDFGGTFRYDYAVYNMNSERGIASFSVPVGSAEVITGFSAPRSHDEEDFTNVPWAPEGVDGELIWSTEPYTPEKPPKPSNPIRWGTMYNFWFESDAAPVVSVATLGRYRPGEGPSFLRARVLGPAPGDCNGNQTSDAEDIFNGTSDDADQDGLPDECEFCTRSAACGAATQCKEHACRDGWCLHRPLVYGDANDDGLLRRADIDCVVDAFAFIPSCPRPDWFPCSPDQEVTMDDVLAVLEAIRGPFTCCLP